MNFGLAIFPTEDTMPPAELGRAAEERGFESILFPEHTHIPSERKSPWPGGAELPREYPRNLDPFVAMTAAATVTKSLLVGTGICLVIQRDPIVLAKEVASVDYISGGRVLFGVGGGWNVEEMANHGTEFKSRWKLMRERIEAMKEIWSDPNMGNDTDIGAPALLEGSNPPPPARNNFYLLHFSINFSI